MRALPERLKDVSCIGAIQIDIIFTFIMLVNGHVLCSDCSDYEDILRYQSSLNDVTAK